MGLASSFYRGRRERESVGRGSNGRQQPLMPSMVRLQWGARLGERKRGTTVSGAPLAGKREEVGRRIGEQQGSALGKPCRGGGGAMCPRGRATRKGEERAMGWGPRAIERGRGRKGGGVAVGPGGRFLPFEANRIRVLFFLFLFGYSLKI